MRPIAETCGIYRLHEGHLAELQVLASDPAIAATTRLPQPYPPDGARTFFAAASRERDAGTAHHFAIEDAGRPVGMCGVQGITAARGEIGYWVGTAHQGRGIATHAVRTLVAIAFDHLHLERLWAEVLASNTASRHVLHKAGFAERGERAHDVPRWPTGVPLVRYEITRALWHEHMHGPTLRVLHPALRAILERELAAGNEVREATLQGLSGVGAFVSLRHPFRALPDPLPEGVVHRVSNDPHWWRAELSAGSPPHLLVH